MMDTSKQPTTERLTYSAKLACSNCGHKWQATFFKGSKIGSGAKCPKCATSSGSKDWSVTAD